VSETTTRRAPGPARSLTRGQIVQAGLQIMRADGLDAVSMRSVSRALGVNPMALYTYVSDKDELLAAMFDEVMRELAPPGPKDRRAPEDQLIAYFSGARRLYMTHADLYRLVRPSVRGNELATAQVERVTQLFLDAGVPASQVIETWIAVLHLTLGSALFGASAVGASAHGVVDSVLGLDPPPERSVLRSVVDETSPRDPQALFESTVRGLIQSSARPPSLLLGEGNGL
jgi:TetR/AcrR family tetracycline transcriptional repressor